MCPSNGSNSGGGGGGVNGRNYIEHQISNMDTLAGMAIKYGVEVAHIKILNGLATDLQMFALKNCRYHYQEDIRHLLVRLMVLRLQEKTILKRLPTSRLFQYVAIIRAHRNEIISKEGLSCNKHFTESFSSHEQFTELSAGLSYCSSSTKSIIWLVIPETSNRW